MSMRAVWRGVRRDPAHFVRAAASAVAAMTLLITLRIRAAFSRRPLIVIALTERLGDIVACEPMIRRIRGESPRALIAWVGKPSYLALLRDHPDLDAQVSIQCVTVWIILRRFPVWNRLCDLHVGNRECDRCRIHLATKNPAAAEINTFNYYDFGTLLESFSRAAGWPAARTDQPWLPPYPESAARIAALNLPDRFVVVHCSSEEEARNWNPDRWQQLARHIVASYELPIVEVGIVPVLESGPGASVIDLCGRCSLPDTVEVIRRSALFIGIDSGPAHLANAARVPGVVLLGQYRSFRSYLPYTGMYSDRLQSRVIHYDGPICALPLQVAEDAVDELLGAGKDPGTVAELQLSLEDRV